MSSFGGLKLSRRFAKHVPDNALPARERSPAQGSGVGGRPVLNRSVFYPSTSFDGIAIEAGKIPTPPPWTSTARAVAALASLPLQLPL